MNLTAATLSFKLRDSHMFRTAGANSIASPLAAAADKTASYVFDGPTMLRSETATQVTTLNAIRMLHITWQVRVLLVSGMHCIHKNACNQSITQNYT